MTMTDPLAAFDASTFATHVGSSFGVRRVPPTTLTLVEVAEPEPDDQPDGFEVFSLLFRGAAADFIGQGMHPLAHEALGEFELFVVPIGRDGDDIVYEAAFNRFARS
jgi:hypothetical protein